MKAAKKRISKQMRFSKEELDLVGMYRVIPSRWEKNALFIVLQSLAWGRLNPDTDRKSWDQMRRFFGLPKQAKAARHG